MASVTSLRVNTSPTLRRGANTHAPPSDQWQDAANVGKEVKHETRNKNWGDCHHPFGAVLYRDGEVPRSDHRTSEGRTCTPGSATRQYRLGTGEVGNG